MGIEKFVGEIKKVQISTIIEITPLERVSHFENTFFENSGISIQVLKLENDIWKQTSGLDNLTLKDMKIMGRNSSDVFIM